MMRLTGALLLWVLVRSTWAEDMIPPNGEEDPNADDLAPLNGDSEESPPAEDDASTCFADDDSVYTQDACSEVDAVACESYCQDSYFCSHHCGSGTSSCEDGAGALCAMNKLTHLKTLCSEKFSIPSNWTSAADSSNWIDPTSLATSTVEGCDDHAYCLFCKDNEWCSWTMNDLAPLLLQNSYVNLKAEGYGPLAMTMLGKLNDVCGYVEEFDDDDSSSSFFASNRLYIEVGGTVGGALVIAVVFVAFRRRISPRHQYHALDGNEV